MYPTSGYMEYIVPSGVQSGVQSGVHSKILWTNLVHMVHKVQNMDQFWSTKFQQGMNYYNPHGHAHLLDDRALDNSLSCNNLKSLFKTFIKINAIQLTRRNKKDLQFTCYIFRP